jgi:3'(2'), 5'-bisphosphate nucleotidase
VLEAAGGAVVTTEGTPLRYNQKAGLLNPNFLAFGDRARDWLSLLAR